MAQPTTLDSMSNFTVGAGRYTHRFDDHVLGPTVLVWIELDPSGRSLRIVQNDVELGKVSVNKSGQWTAYPLFGSHISVGNDKEGVEAILVRWRNVAKCLREFLHAVERTR